MALLDVAVAGTKVSVAFDEALDGDKVPPARAFTVKRTPQESSEETVSLSGAPSITGGAVILTLTDAVVATDTGVKVSYAQPTAAGTSKLKDAAGNEAASFTDRSADATDTTPPALVRGEFDGDVITLYFSEPLDEIYETYEATESGFRVYLQLLSPNLGHTPDFAQCVINLGALALRATPQEVIIDGNRVTLVKIAHGYESETHRAIVGRERNRAHYSQYSNNNAKLLRDLAGNVASKARVYLDNVTHLPLPEQATVVGNRLTLTFSAPMDGNSKPTAGAFTVKVNGSAVGLASANPVAVSGRDVTLTLAAAVASGDTVTVSYEKPDFSWLRNVLCEYAPRLHRRACDELYPVTWSEVWANYARGTKAAEVRPHKCDGG